MSISQFCAAYLSIHRHETRLSLTQRFTRVLESVGAKDISLISSVYDTDVSIFSYVLNGTNCFISFDRKGSGRVHSWEVIDLASLRLFARDLADLLLSRLGIFVPALTQRCVDGRGFVRFCGVTRGFSSRRDRNTVQVPALASCIVAPWPFEEKCALASSLLRAGSEFSCYREFCLPALTDVVLEVLKTVPKDLLHSPEVLFSFVRHALRVDTHYSSFKVTTNSRKC
jgi:hypothetical protein